jgi:hypothetical protein
MAESRINTSSYPLPLRFSARQQRRGPEDQHGTPVKPDGT